MEFWKSENSMKTEKSTAMRFNIHKAQTLVRILEIASALILIFWFTTRLPIALKLLIDFAKQTLALLLTTPSVFLIGNAIIVTLVAQFQSLTASSSDFYDEFVSETRNRIAIPTQSIQIVEKIEPLPNSSILLSSDPAGAESESEGIKCCRRTQSERITSVRCDEMIRKELRRTRTESRGEMKMMKVETAAFKVVDELNGDEFRRRVEAFIAKQQRFIRDENVALVVSN